MLKRIAKPMVLMFGLLALGARGGHAAADRNADETKPSISADGIGRTVLENYPIPGTDQEFKMVLTVYPPGVSLPSHHHPAAALNYILEGTAQSQYAGEKLKTLKSGDTFQDKPDRQHLIFRNPDKTRPLRFIIVYTIKKGSSFLLVP